MIRTPRAEKLVKVPIKTANGGLADAGVATMRSPEVATVKATSAAPVRRNNPSLDLSKFRFISDTSKSSSGKPGGSFDFIVLRERAHMWRKVPSSRVFGP